MVALFAMRVETVDADVLERLVGQVSARRQEQFYRFRQRDDAVRCLFGELMIRRIVMNETNARNEEIEFAVNAYGKPEIVAPVRQQYNISHSGRWIVCATGASAVGVDVEEMRPIELDIAKSFFSPGEIRQLFELPEARRQERFYELWTLKESYIKAVGKGLSIPLASFSFDFDAANERYELFEGMDRSDYEAHLIPFDERYKLAVCSRKLAVLPEVRLWSMQDWLRRADMC